MVPNIITKALVLALTTSKGKSIWPLSWWVHIQAICQGVVVAAHAHRVAKNKAIGRDHALPSEEMGMGPHFVPCLW